MKKTAYCDYVKSTEKKREISKKIKRELKF